MTVRKLKTGKWICECYPNGAKGRRIRKTFVTRGEALAFENHIMKEVNNKPWLGEKKDQRRLSELIMIWYQSHGITLKTGDEMLRAMQFACDYFNDPLATDFTAKDYTDYREKRLSGNVFRRDKVQNVTLRTLNKDLKTFKSMFNELIRMGEWEKDNPLKTIREFKEQTPEMAFLTKQQIDALLHECKASRSNDLIKIVKLALATGARWSEAEKLTSNKIAKYRVTFTKTKTDLERTVPISESLYNEITENMQNNHRLFTGCYKSFGRAIDRANIELPKGQLSHVLRHTFASHFVMNGGSILVLQKILGHTDIKTTMRYAHFAPNHLKEAVTLNPLDNPANV